MVKTREETLKKIKECRDQALRLMEIAPDAVPGFLRQLVLDEEGVEGRLDAAVKDKDDSAQAAFYLMVDIGISNLTKQLGKFEADLRSRCQPEGQPRVKRKFKQFKVRKGEW